MCGCTCVPGVAALYLGVGLEDECTVGTSDYLEAVWPTVNHWQRLNGLAVVQGKHLSYSGVLCDT